MATTHHQPLQASPTSRRYLRRREAANYTGIAESTLAADVCRPRLHIPIIRAGRSILYDVADLDAWLAARKVEV